MGGRAHIREGKPRLGQKGRGTGRKIGRGSSSTGKEEVEREYTGGRRGSGPRTRRGSSSLGE